MGIAVTAPGLLNVAAAAILVMSAGSPWKASTLVGAFVAPRSAAAASRSGAFEVGVAEASDLFRSSGFDAMDRPRAPPPGGWTCSPKFDEALACGSPWYA